MPLTPKQKQRRAILVAELYGNSTITAGGQTYTVPGGGVLPSLQREQSYWNAAKQAIDNYNEIDQQPLGLPKSQKDNNRFVVLLRATQGSEELERVRIYTEDEWRSKAPSIHEENVTIWNTYQTEIDKLKAEADKLEKEIAEIDAAKIAAEEQDARDQARKRGKEQEATAAGDERKIQDQCFLLANLKDIVGTPLRPNVYSNLGIITGNTNLIVNALTSRKKGNTMLDARPEEFSHLQPLIRFSKVFLDDKAKPIGKEQPFPFKTMAFSPTMPQSAIDEAGIEAFTYAFQGQDFVTADTHLKCTAKFYFKSMGSFVREHNVTPKKGVKETIRFADLASYPRVGANYIVKATIGWNHQGVQGNSELRNSIKDSKISLWLQPQSFSYSFNDDGSLSVDVSYVGAIYSMLRDTNFDIFEQSRSRSNFDTITIRRLEAFRSLLQDLQSKGKELGQFIKNSPDELRQMAVQKAADHFVAHDSDDPAVDEFLSLIDNYGTKMTGFSSSNWNDLWVDKDEFKEPKMIPEKVEKILEEIDKDIAQRRQTSKYIRWKVLLENILNKDGIFRVSIPSNRFSDYQNEYRNGSLVIESRDRYAQSRKSYPGKIKVEKVRATTDLADIHSAVGKKYKSLVADQDEDAAMPIVGEGPLTRGGEYDINFIYFGALVNAALETLADARRGAGKSVYNNIDFLLGPIDLPVLSGGNVKFEQFSLADVPISLDLFLKFFVSDIVEGGRGQYNVVDFLTNVLNKLVIPALGEMCFDISDRPMVVKQAIVRTVDTPTQSSGRMATRPIELNTRVALSDVKKSFENRKFDSTDPSLLRYYILLYSADQEVAKILRRGDEETFSGFKDRIKKEGIYVLHTGRSVGLVNNVSFTMSKQQYVQESRITTSTHQGLYIDHNVDIDMIGNTLFSNGQMVFLDPNYIGMGASRDNVQKLLRIGGFYEITNVEGTIGMTGFQTKLKCIYQNT